MIFARRLFAIFALLSLTLGLAGQASAQGGTQLPDGKYTVTAGDPGNAGTVLSTNGGKDLAFVSTGGQGALWEWDATAGHYDLVGDTTGLSLQFTQVVDDSGKPVAGQFEWELQNAQGGTEDKGTAKSSSD